MHVKMIELVPFKKQNSIFCTCATSIWYSVFFKKTPLPFSLFFIIKSGANTLDVEQLRMGLRRFVPVSHK